MKPENGPSNYGGRPIEFQRVAIADYERQRRSVLSWAKGCADPRWLAEVAHVARLFAVAADGASASLETKSLDETESLYKPTSSTAR